MYQHCNIRSHTKNSDEETKKLELEIYDLKAEISLLKEENDIKVQTLAKVHMLEMGDLKQKNNILVKEASILKKQNNKLQTAMKPVSDVCRNKF